MRSLLPSTVPTYLNKQTSDLLPKHFGVSDGIGQRNRIETCEQRLALSASLPADLLIDAFNLDVVDNDNALPIPVSNPEPALLSINQPEGAESPDQHTSLHSQVAQLPNSSGLTGKGQTIAVIDSGVAWDHVSLGEGFGPGYRVVGGWDFAENDENPYDDGPAGFHGTHVANLLAGTNVAPGDAGDSLVGIAPDADLVALRVFDDYGAGDLKWIESALQWVHDNQHTFDSPITTVNLSIGAALTDDNRNDALTMIEDELAQLRADDILVFAAAGNHFNVDNPDNGLTYPASSQSVIPVGSIDEHEALSDFSQRANGMFAANGQTVRSAVPDHVYGWDGKVDDYASLSGTSMATPQVAAASVLVRQSLIEQGIEPTAENVIQAMRERSNIHTDTLSGAGYHVLDLESIQSDANTQSSNHQLESTVVDKITRFVGTSDNESYILDLRDGIELRNGENVFRFDAESTESLSIDVGHGADSLSILGSPNAERIILHPANSESDISSLSTGQFRIELHGIETVSFDGGGGNDRATIYDSSEDDLLRSEPTKATLSGIGFQFDVFSVPRIFVHATSGGEDQAFLSDSTADDRLAVRPQFTSMHSEGGAFQAAYGFEKVYAYANSGGNDTASIYDSTGDDTLTISPSRSLLIGDGYQVKAQGFSSTEAFATAGGDDLASIYDDGPNQSWHQDEDRLQSIGINGDVRIARGFEQMRGFQRSQAFDDYQPIAMTPQDFSSIGLDDEDDRMDLYERERRAAQSIFEQLGEE